MLSEKLHDALNEQINAELWSAYLYLSMSMDAEAKGATCFRGGQKLPERGYYFVVLAVLVVAVLVTLNLLRSRVGRAFMAIREHDIAARAMGVDLVRWKLLAFMVSAFYTGIAGGLLAYYTRYLNVDSFSLLISIEALSMLIVGGLGSVGGCFIGALLMALVANYAGFLAPKLALVSNIGLMIAILLWRPAGLYARK